MANSKMVTCSFQMNRDVYNQYKSIVVRNGRNVKEDIIKYMQNVIATDTPNAETLAAFKEVEQMKADNSLGRAYNDVDEMMEDLLK